MDEDSLQELYTWIDEIPLSRPKKNITRDFSDGGKLTISFANMKQKSYKGNIFAAKNIGLVVCPEIQNGFLSSLKNY